MIVTMGKHTAETYRKISFTDVSDDGRVLGTGHTSEAAGTRTAEIELLIDEAKLIRLLKGRVLLSKGRRVVIQSGAIILRVRKGTESETVLPHSHTKRCYRDGQIACGHAA